MKKTTILFFCLLMGFAGLRQARAQQDPMFSQYMFNTMALNPAYAGDNEVVNVTGLYRRQWVDIEGAPNTGTFSIDAPFWDDKAGVGLNIVSDRIGVTNTTGVFGYYAYRIKMGDNARLAMGVSGGFSSYRANLTDVNLAQNQVRPDIAYMQNLNLILPNFGAGIWFNTDKFFAGLSVPHFVNNSLAGDTEFLMEGERSQQERHYFLMTGYVFDMGNDIKLKPSTLLKWVEGSAIQFDLNCNVYFYDLIGVGVSYRSGDAVVGLFDIQVSHQFRLSYAYDYTLSQLNAYNSGSHEIMLRYQFSFKKDKIITPRFF